MARFVYHGADDDTNFQGPPICFSDRDVRRVIECCKRHEVGASQ